MFNPAPVRKLLFYRQKQPIYDEWSQSGLLDEMSEGMPDKNDLLARLSEYKDNGGCLIFFDDMSSLVQNYEEDFVHYWTVVSHHYNVSFFLVLHSLFSPALRMLSLNTHRFFLTKSPRDVSQVRTLASQAFPGRSSFVVHAYEDATSRQYGFLILDFSPNCNSKLRVVANIFGEEPPSTYEYKDVTRSQMVKMENKFRKQALIPWTEFLRLRSKAEINNVRCPTNSSCGQSSSCRSVLQQCETPIVYDNRSLVVPSPVSKTESQDDGKSDYYPSKAENLVPEAKVSSSLPPIEPSSASSPTQIVTSSAPPILHSVTPTPVPTKTIILKSAWQSSRPSIKKVLGRHKPIKGLIPTQAAMEISSPQHLLASPSSHDIPLPSLPPPVSPSSTPISLQTSPQPPKSTEHLTTPSRDLPAITYSPSSPSPSGRKKQDKTQKKVDEPARARENIEQKPQDSVYPKALHRDQDIQPNPSSFPLKRKEKKRQHIKSKIFLPSPPYTTTQVPKKAIKRKNVFSKPRPTLPVKQRKYNRGEKRKFQGHMMDSKKNLKVHPSTGQRTKPLGDTDFDIW